MRKYREVMRVYLKAQLAWRADVVFSMIFTVSKILFGGFNLSWDAVLLYRQFLFVPAGNGRGHQRGDQRQDTERDIVQLYGSACEHGGIFYCHGGGSGAFLSKL